MYKRFIKIIFASCILLAGLSARAGDVEIKNVVMQKTGSSWSFEVTLKHGDTGWKHYANAWRVVDQKGKVIKTRILGHPHVDEQPFTRGLSGVNIPAGAKSVTVEARDKVHGWSKDKVVIDLKVNKGKKYLIKQ